METTNLILGAATFDTDILKRIKAIVDGSEAILDELQMVIASDGIRLRMLDSSKACMIEWHLASSIFKEYFYSGDDKSLETDICLGSREMKHALKDAKTGLEFYLKKDKKRLMVTAHSTVKQTSAITLLVPADDRAKQPSLTYMANVRVKGKELTQVIKACSKMSSHLIFKVGPDTEYDLQVDGEGDVGEFSAVISHEDIFKVDAYNAQEAKCRYALNYLVKMTKFWLKTDWINVQFSTNKPVKLSGDLPCGSNFSMILAPRVERRGDL